MSLRRELYAGDAAYSHEADNGGNFDGREKEFSLTVTPDAHEIDAHNDEQDYGHEDGRAQILVPVPDGQGTCDNFQWQRE